MTFCEPTIPLVTHDACLCAGCWWSREIVPFFGCSEAWEIVLAPGWVTRVREYCIELGPFVHTDRRSGAKCRDLGTKGSNPILCHASLIRSFLFTFRTLGNALRFLTALNCCASCWLCMQFFMTYIIQICEGGKFVARYADHFARSRLRGSLFYPLLHKSYVHVRTIMKQRMLMNVYHVVQSWEKVLSCGWPLEPNRAPIARDVPFFNTRGDGFCLRATIKSRYFARKFICTRLHQGDINFQNIFFPFVHELCVTCFILKC